MLTVFQYPEGIPAINRLVKRSDTTGLALEQSADPEGIAARCAVILSGSMKPGSRGSGGFRFA
jgi:hypothetical protein